jgi:hypothetical protein
VRGFQAVGVRCTLEVGIVRVVYGVTILPGMKLVTPIEERLFAERDFMMRRGITSD